MGMDWMPVSAIPVEETGNVERFDRLLDVGDQLRLFVNTHRMDRPAEQCAAARRERW